MKAAAAQPDLGRMSWATGAAVCLAFAATCFVYAWTVDGTPGSLDFSRPKGDYYNLLVQGFQRGHLYLNAVPDPALLALPERARPGSAPYLMDASLYQGHYYLYFGPVPAVLLFWPYAAVTGRSLPEGMGGLVFSILGTGWAVLLWLDLRRRLFPRTGAVWTGLAVLALGLGTAIPVSLRHPLFYETATAAGYAFGMLQLWALWRARSGGRYRPGWLILAGLGAGLAIGSRANLGPAALIVLALGAAGAARQAGGSSWRRQCVFRLAWAAFGAGTVGAGLITYNLERFGHPLEFGHSYQLGLNPRGMFHRTNLEHNLGLYYLSPPALNAYFPFVAPRTEGPKPDDYVGREQADGEWVWWPLIGLAGAGLASALTRSRRDSERRLDSADLIWACLIPGGWFAVNLVVTGAAGARANRYMMDFHPALAVVLMIGVGLAVEGRGWRPRLATLLAGVGMLAAILFNLLASFEVHGFFAGNDPVAYDRLARFADRVVWPILRWGAPVGDRELVLRWPAVVPVGTLEPMVGAGTPTFDDVLWVEYGAANRARFVYDFDEQGSAFGQWFPIRGGEAARVRISGAFLLPRAGHPWYGDRPAAEQRALKQTLRVLVDDEVRFQRAVPSHDSSPRLQRWGAWRLIDGETRVFRGAALRVRDLPLDARPVQEAIAANAGGVAARVLLPIDRIGWIEPLVQFGGLRRFDLIAIRYVRPGVIRLIHDQAGGGADQSAEITTDYAAWHNFQVETPAATDDLDWRDAGPLQRGRVLSSLRVSWDGKLVFESKHRPLATEAQAVVLGADLCGSSISLPMFRGLLVAGDRLAPLGRVGAGRLEFDPRGPDPWVGEHGVIARFTSAGGDTANVVWRRSTGRAIQLGWNEAGSTVWSRPGLTDPAAPLCLSLPSAAVDSGPVRLTMGTGFDVTAAADLFSDPPVRAEAIRSLHWTGPARDDHPAESPAALVSGASLPGAVRLSFRLPEHRLIAGSPLLSAGKTGAADSVYLRQLADGRFVLGFDHWMFPATESAPFELSDQDVHVVVIALGSLDGVGGRNRRGVRLAIDGRVVLDSNHELYAVLPGEVAFGANPLAMSTSGAKFDGEILAVRQHVHAPPALKSPH